MDDSQVPNRPHILQRDRILLNAETDDMCERSRTGKIVKAMCWMMQMLLLVISGARYCYPMLSVYSLSACMMSGLKQEDPSDAGVIGQRHLDMPGM